MPCDDLCIVERLIPSHGVICVFLASVEKEMVSVEVARMLTLAEQCLERAKSFVGKSTEPPDLSASAFSSGSPGLPEPHQTAVVPVSHTAVVPASHTADTGEYVLLQSEASLL